MSQHRSSPDPRNASPAGTASFRSPAAVARLLVTAAVGVAIDLVTKAWSFDKLMYNQVSNPDGSVHFQSHTYRFLPGWLHFHITGNHGAVFGTGQGYRWWFVSVSVVAIGFLIYLFASSAPRQRWYQIIVGMLLGGVLGNLYDRIVFGYVRDMIYILPGRTWPQWLADLLPGDWAWTRAPVFPWIFNVADALLCIGVALMVLHSAVMARKAPRERPAGLEPVES